MILVVGVNILLKSVSHSVGLYEAAPSSDNNNVWIISCSILFHHKGVSVSPKIEMILGTPMSRKVIVPLFKP